MIEIVDQYYWLGYAKKEIDGTAQALTDAAGKVSTLVATFWTIYTTSFIIGTTLKKLDEGPFVMFLLVLPIPLLILSYMAALWAQMPQLELSGVKSGVDPRIPDDVMKYYNQTIKDKKKRVMTSLIIFAIASVSLTYALIEVNFTHDKKDISQTITFRPSKGHLFFAGDVPNGTMVRYTVNDSKKQTPDSTLVTANGHFDKTITTPENGAFTITFTWKDADPNVVHSYSKFFPSAQTAGH